MITIETLHVTPAILRLIAEIDEFKGTWRSLRQIAPERLATLRQVATIESAGSSTRIEGSTLSDIEVEALLARLETQSFRSRDEEEVAGYAEVMENIFSGWEHIPLTENYIKQLHGMLLKHSRKDERHRGSYKTLPNHVEAFGPDGQSLGVVFKTATPFETPFRMAELVEWTQEVLNVGEVHPLIVVAVFVVVFLAIHPFQDGNGRLSRVLTTLLLLRAGYAYVPYSSLESVIEERKESYYLALRRTQTTLDTPAPDWEPWTLFFLQALRTQAVRLEAKVGREHLLEAALPELSVRILTLAREHGRIRTSDVVTLTGQSRSTIKVRLNDLVARGYLTRHGGGRSTWYTVMSSLEVSR